MPTLTLRASLAALAVLVVACTGSGAGASPAALPAGPSDAPPSASAPAIGAIDHMTGATDVILRLDEGGGFIAPAFTATQAPIFTLYGDGTVIFRNPQADPLAPVGDVFPFHPFRIVKIGEEQIQVLLASALGEAGLGVALPDYRNDHIADAATTVFTLAAGGIKKTVSIYALEMTDPGMADLVPRLAFAKFAARLMDFDNGGVLATQEYTPERYRGVLLEGQPGASGASGSPGTRPWPWADIKPTDFVSNGDPNAFHLPAHVLTAAQVQALGILPYQGGLLGLTLMDPKSGKSYSLSLRPLLPGETN